MDIMNDIKISLSNNPELTDSVKGNIYELIAIFHEKFKQVNLDNLKNKLETLKIVKIGKFVNPSVSMYDFKKNIIYLNASEMQKGYDMKHVLMYELINVISSTNEYTGFNVDDKYKALNIGYTEILANFLVGNDGEVSIYQLEAATANLLSILVGIDTLFEAYFTNNFEILAKKIVDMGVVVA